MACGSDPIGTKGPSKTTEVFIHIMQANHIGWVSAAVPFYKHPHVDMHRQCRGMSTSAHSSGPAVNSPRLI
eukprot:1160590-Pelagomonas_calceolata.AAC.5